jgi:hypothetical protein
MMFLFGLNLMIAAILFLGLRLENTDFPFVALARKSKQEFLMKDFRLATLSLNVMWNFCTIF